MIPLAAVFAASARTVNGVETKAHADSTYVQLAVFAAHVRDQAATHTLDSTVQANRDEKLLGAVMRLDTTMRKCFRFPEACK